MGLHGKPDEQGLPRTLVEQSRLRLHDAGVRATVGSTNLDGRTFLHNHTRNAVVLGAVFGGPLRAMFEQDLARSDAVALEQRERRLMDQRLEEWFARDWEYGL